MKTLGLIAGGGNFPRLVAQSAAREGFRVVAFGLEGQIDDDLSDTVDAVHIAPVHEFKFLLDKMKEEGVTDAVMAGAVSKASLAKSGKEDSLGKQAFKPLKSRGDDSLLRAVAGIMESAGITVRSAIFCAPDLAARAGIMTDKQPTEHQLGDIEFGWGIAKEFGRLDIGQTLVVKSRAVVAVEAMEGTDATIQRAGELVGPGCVVVKVSKPQQDLRFDMPAIGPNTIETMASAGAKVIAVDADKTVVIDKDLILSLAAEHNIVIIAQ